jgi:hypothetical protein
LRVDHSNSLKFAFLRKGFTPSVLASIHIWPSRSFSWDPSSAGGFPWCQMWNCQGWGFLTRLAALGPQLPGELRGLGWERDGSLIPKRHAGNQGVIMLIGFCWVYLISLPDFSETHKWTASRCLSFSF